MKTKLSEKKISLKTYLVTSIFIAVLVFGMAQYIFANPGTSTITIEPNSFQETASYIISTDGTYYYMKNGTTGQVDSSTNASQIFSQAMISNETVFVKKGTYLLNGTTAGIHINGLANITLTLESGACLYAMANLNNPVVYVYSSSNILIMGGEIDGNSANQASSGGSYTQGIETGIVFAYSANCTVQNMYIHNCRQFGAYVQSGHDVKILFSTFDYNNWNGIQLGYDLTTYSCQAIGNTITHSSDIGISLYGLMCSAMNNVVYNMDGVLGGGGNSHWGIATEGTAKWCEITGNIVYNCTDGIYQSFSGTDSYTRISQNIVYNITSYGIYLYAGNKVSVEGNSVHLSPSAGETVAGIRFDTLNNSIVNNYVWVNDSHGIFGQYGNFSTLRGNDVESVYWWSIRLYEKACNNTLIGNTMRGQYGLNIGTGCNYNYCIANDFRLCSSITISNSGTGNTNNCYLDQSGYHA
jgi:hypothetical protein